MHHPDNCWRDNHIQKPTGQALIMLFQREEEENLIPNCIEKKRKIGSRY